MTRKELDELLAIMRELDEERRRRLLRDARDLLAAKRAGVLRMDHKEGATR